MRIPPRLAVPAQEESGICEVEEREARSSVIADRDGKLLPLSGEAAGALPVPFESRHSGKGDQAPCGAAPVFRALAKNQSLLRQRPCARQVVLEASQESRLLECLSAGSGWLGGAVECVIEPASCRAPLASKYPEVGEGRHQSYLERLVFPKCPLERGADVPRFLGEPAHGGCLIACQELTLGDLGELDEEFGMPLSESRRFGRFFEALGRIVADRLENRETFPVADETLLHQRLKRINTRAADLLSGRERKRAGEHRETTEQPLLRRLKQVVGPLDRRA